MTAAAAEGTGLFVSYKSEDRERVAPLVTALEADGVPDIRLSAYPGQRSGVFVASDSRSLGIVNQSNPVPGSVKALTFTVVCCNMQLASKALIRQTGAPSTPPISRLPGNRL